jgi:predicted nucleic acid-binding protein
VIVVDTNVIAYFYVTSDRSEQAVQVMTKDSDWIVPPLWRSEFRNALSLYVRQGILSLNDVLVLVEAAERLLKDKEIAVDSAEVLPLAVSSSCSAYDCEFVSLAQRLHIPLITVDKQILNEFPDIAVTPGAFVSG